MAHTAKVSKPIDDERDAALILDVARKLSALERRGMSSPWVMRAMREAVKVTWEVPRRGPILGSQYPVGVPWSKAARTLVKTNQDRVPAGALVLEHVVPVGVVCRELVDNAGSSTVAAVCDKLRSELRHAVILKHEEPKLSYDPTRTWSRYTDGDFPDGFAPYRSMD